MHATLQRIIAQAVDLPLDGVWIELRPPLAHQSNRLYDAWAGDRHLIVKEFLKPDEINDAPVREARALEFVAALDIAPRLVLYQEASASLSLPIVVYEWMEGEMWTQRRPSSQDLAQLAASWLALHALPQEQLWMSRGYERSIMQIEANWRTRFRMYADWAHAYYPAGQRAAELCLELLDRRREMAAELDRSTPVACFCRGDARFANVLRRPGGRLGLVDWEDCGLRDPAQDVSDLITAADQEDVLDWDDWQAFLHPYLAERHAVDLGLERRVQLYLAIFPLFWLVTLASHGLQRAQNGQLAGWTVNSMPPNLRLRRYLARALAWPAMHSAEQLAALTDVTFFPEPLAPGEPAIRIPI